MQRYTLYVTLPGTAAQLNVVVTPLVAAVTVSTDVGRVTAARVPESAYPEAAVPRIEYV